MSICSLHRYRWSNSIWIDGIVGIELESQGMCTIQKSLKNQSHSACTYGHSTAIKVKVFLLDLELELLLDSEVCNFLNLRKLYKNYYLQSHAYSYTYIVKCTIGCRI